eukprot:scaffold162_cov267-Chaetoceros_neogracile.AAC.50
MFVDRSPASWPNMILVLEIICLKLRSIFALSTFCTRPFLGLLNYHSNKEQHSQLLWKRKLLMNHNGGLYMKFDIFDVLVDVCTVERASKRSAHLELLQDLKCSRISQKT